MSDLPDTHLKWLSANSPSPAFLYHYIRWGWFRDWLANGAATLSNPLRWDDPTEWLWTNWIHQNVANSVLCMCWTRTKRSEANWVFERGRRLEWSEADQAMIRIRTTYDRLSQAVSNSEDLQGKLHGTSFLVPVKYLTNWQLERRFDGLSSRKTVAREAAAALSYKRYPYRHEKEVRLVHVTNSAHKVQDHQRVRIDLNTLVDQIMIDPRSSEGVAGQVRGLAIAMGFRNEVKQSMLFRLPASLRALAVRPDSDHSE